jgi:hypothetical protein
MFSAMIVEEVNGCLFGSLFQTLSRAIVKKFQ